MPLSLLPALLLQILVVGYTPGPANIYALTMGVKYGKTHAMRAWAGLFAGFTLAALVIVILTHFIGAVMGKYIVWLKYLGRVASIKNIDSNKCCQKYGEVETCVHCQWGCKMMQLLWKILCSFSNN